MVLPTALLNAAMGGSSAVAPNMLHPEAAAAAARSVQGGYDEALAQSDIWLNQAVSCGVDKLKNWTCGPACDAVPTLARRLVSVRKMDTFALVARTSPGECAVVFRGSKDFLNTLQDMDFFPKTLPGCTASSSTHYYRN